MFDEDTSKLQVKGGPPPPQRNCAFCGAMLSGHPKHKSRPVEQLLFCDSSHRKAYENKHGLPLTDPEDADATGPTP